MPEGEVGEVIVGGVTAPPGATLWEQRAWMAEDETLRNFLLNEPRGGVFRHVNLLVPPKHPEADAAFIIMEPEDTPPMSGSSAICFATVLLDAGILPMVEPETRIALEAPGGLVRVRAECQAGKAERIFVQNLPPSASTCRSKSRASAPSASTPPTAATASSLSKPRALGFALEAKRMRSPDLAHPSAHARSFGPRAGRLSADRSLGRKVMAETYGAAVLILAEPADRVHVII